MNLKKHLASLPEKERLEAILRIFNEFGFNVTSLQPPAGFGSALGYPWFMSLFLRTGGMDFMRTRAFEMHLKKTCRILRNTWLKIQKDTPQLLNKAMRTHGSRKKMRDKKQLKIRKDIIRNIIPALYLAVNIENRIRRHDPSELVEPFFYYFELKNPLPSGQPRFVQRPAKGTYSKNFTSRAQYRIHEVAVLVEAMAPLEAWLTPKTTAERKALGPEVMQAIDSIRKMIQAVVSRTLMLATVYKQFYDLLFALQLNNKNVTLPDTDLQALIDATGCDGAYYLRLRDLPIVKAIHARDNAIDAEKGKTIDIEMDRFSHARLHDDVAAQAEDKRGKRPGEEKMQRSLVCGDPVLVGHLKKLLVKQIIDLDIPDDEAALMHLRLEGASCSKAGQAVVRGRTKAATRKHAERALKPYEAIFRKVLNLS